MFILLPRARELLPPDIATSTTLNDKATSEVSSEQYFTTPAEAALSSRSTSETPINIKRGLSTSSPPRDHTPDSTSSPAEKPPSPPATSSPSAASQKEPPSATLSPQSEIRALSPDAQAPTPPSSDTLKTAARPESDFPQAPERPSTVTAEPPSASSPEEAETKSPS